MMRDYAVLVCPDNDAEARMILMIAEKAKIPTVKSNKLHGEGIDVEVSEVQKLRTEKTKEVWIVELANLEKEEELRKLGFHVVIIDHHTYSDFDRLTDPNTGKKKPSSLEQFLNVAKITDEELLAFGFDPRIVRGVGIVDAQWIAGLENAGYSKEESKKVFDYIYSLKIAINPDYEKIMDEAREILKNRYKRGDYIVVETDSHTHDIRVTISSLIASEGLYKEPKIISVWNGDKITVEQASQDVVKTLNENIIGKKYTFGSGNCWGLNNTSQEKKVTLEEIFKVLKI